MTKDEAIDSIDKILNDPDITSAEFKEGMECARGFIDLIGEEHLYLSSVIVLKKRNTEERYKKFREQAIECWAVAKSLEEEDCAEKISEVIQYCDEALENIKKELRE